MIAPDFIQNVDTIAGPQPVHQTFNWVFWLLMVFNVIAIAYVRTVNTGYLRVLFRTCVYNRHLYQTTQDDLRLNGAGSVMLTIAYFNCLAVIAGALVPNQPIWFPFVLLGTVCGLVMIKYALMKSVSFMTQIRDGVSEHWINHLIFFQVSGILLTPVLCFSHFFSKSFQSELMPVLLSFVGLMIFYREIQTFLRAIRLRLSIVYIILYLCTLELMPLAIVIRVLINL